MYSKTNTKRWNSLNKGQDILLYYAFQAASVQPITSTYGRKPPYGIRSYCVVARNSIIRHNLHM